MAAPLGKVKVPGKALELILQVVLHSSDSAFENPTISKIVQVTILDPRDWRLGGITGAPHAKDKATPWCTFE